MNNGLYFVILFFLVWVISEYLTKAPIDRTEWSKRLSPKRYRLILWWEKKAYIRSDKWKQKRKEVLKRDNYFCQSCGSEEHLNVHHMTYKHLGDEDLSDLITVCKDCHQEIHEEYGYEYDGYFPLLRHRRKLLKDML